MQALMKWRYTMAFLTLAAMSPLAPSARAGEVVLRDSIGPDNSWTNGTWPFSSQQNPGFFWSNAGAFITTSENTILKTINAIFGRRSSAHNFAELDYVVKIWSSESAFIANQNSGDIANILFNDPTTGPTSWGTTMSLPVIGAQPTWNFGFDLTPFNIQIPAGSTRIISVQIQTGGSGNGGLWGIQESIELDNTDIWAGHDFPSPGWVYIEGSTAFQQFDGRLAVRLTAEILADVCPSGVCSDTESPCTCPQDCGAPAASEMPGSTCGDTLDNDCDGVIDCVDADCAGDAVACPAGQIPAVSEWGLVVLGLTTLVVGSVVLRRRSAA